MPSVPTSGSVPPPPPVWEARPPETAVRYAGFWLRVVAAIVDAIILTVAWQVIELALPAQNIPPIPEKPDYQAFVDMMNALLSPDRVMIYALMVWAYFVFQETSSAQATLGKRMLGIRVSNAEGGRLTLLGASIRTWPIYLPTLAALLGIGASWLVSLFALIACVAVAFSARKQGLHDKMAGAILTRP
ncbi:MAG: RDD family protein [Reyranella sp.]|nr:RDD family protein [Reyranella sp.]